MKLVLVAGGGRGYHSPLCPAGQVLKARTEILQFGRVAVELEKFLVAFAQFVQSIQQTFGLRELECWYLFGQIGIETGQWHVLLFN